MAQLATSRTGEIRAMARIDITTAEAMLSELIADLFAILVQGLRINVDQYSLNSLNGFFASAGEEFFFKFHQEEGEDQMTGEYYRADILARAGLPVDQPILISTVPGEQVLIYRRRSDPRFSDVLLELDDTPAPEAIARAVAAEAELNDRILDCARQTLTPITVAQSASEPIHRLFRERLIDPRTDRFPGGRLAKFYVGKRFNFPGGVSLHWDEIAPATPVINGITYSRSLGELFDLAHTRYAPERLADAGGFVAHGDAHNANVWYERGATADHLTFFDPAFAGDAVPSLLAEVKATFHNVFAHPFWLYDPEIAAERYEAHVDLKDGELRIDTTWRLGEVRRQLLQTKARHFWSPWLETLHNDGLLPPDWVDVIRIGLFLSPTLVMNLNAGEGADRHNPVSSAIGLSVALAAGSRPLASQDIFTQFFAEIKP
jgi:Ser/Thr protein kinase RdoA (MazF antagonist)